MLSKRLKSLVEFINFNDYILDIGCDHALLDIYLIKNKIVPKIVASDIKDSALDMARDNIKKYNVSNIKIKLGNGLDVLEDDINTLVISGMGSRTILEILKKDKLKNIKKIIIQSNTDHELLRKNIVKLGYCITNESVVLDNEKYYINIVFQKGNKKYNKLDYLYGPILKNDNKEYFEYLKTKNENLLKIIPKNKQSVIKKNIDNINKIIKDIIDK